CTPSNGTCGRSSSSSASARASSSAPFRGRARPIHTVRHYGLSATNLKASVRKPAQSGGFAGVDPAAEDGDTLGRPWSVARHPAGVETIRDGVGVRRYILEGTHRVAV